MVKRILEPAMEAGIKVLLLIKVQKMKNTPTSALRLFTALIRNNPDTMSENDNMGGTDSAKKPGMGFQSYPMNHIVPRAAREEKDQDDKKSSKKKDKQKFLDPELEREISYAKHHYADYDDDEQMAFNKYVDRSILSIKKSNKSQNQKIKDIQTAINLLKDKVSNGTTAYDLGPSLDTHQPNLDESTSLVTTVRAIVTYGETVASVYEQMKHAAKQFVDNHGDLDGFNMVAGGIGHRWFQSFYFNKLQKELFDLSKQINRSSAGPLIEFLQVSGQNTPLSFTRISNLLPEILYSIGRNIGNKDLEVFGANWESRKTHYKNFLDKLISDEQGDDAPVKPKSNSNAAIGQQNVQVEKIVNDILSKLPSKIAGDVRNAIAKSPNKLQALMQELQKRNINMSEEQVSDDMLPNTAFAGYPKNKLGPVAQLKGKMKRPAQQGDLVGEAPNSPKPAKQLKTARHQAKNKIKSAYFGKVSENVNLVPVNESVEKIMDQLINQIIYNETVPNNKQ